jgi:hypothetical protein
VKKGFIFLNANRNSQMMINAQEELHLRVTRLQLWVKMNVVFCLCLIYFEKNKENENKTPFAVSSFEMKAAGNITCHALFVVVPNNFVFEMATDTDKLRRCDAQERCFAMWVTMNATVHATHTLPSSKHCAATE